MMSQRKKYAKEFKIDAINLLQEQGYSCSEAAKSHDIPYVHLNRWIKERKKLDTNEDFRGNGKLTSEQLEIQQLKEETRGLKRMSVFFGETIKPAMKRSMIC
ncbi:MAG: hypothetical protein EBY16_05475 [Gammaproteobacteria bacterium]|nr:hypothetical protein [Gammaproteobacteria bacterium]